MTCDDTCELQMGLTSGDSKDLKKILDIGRHTEYRFYRAQDGQTRQSEWVSLEAGKHYYIEADVQEYGGGDHLTVAVEIEKEDTKNHHHAMKEIVEMTVGTEDVKETTRIIVTAPDDKPYKLVFTHPETFKKHITGNINANASASAVRDAVYDYFRRQSKARTSITVVRTYLDAAGKVTEDKKDMKSYQYDIALNKLVTE
jgi:hypothetical protein